MDNYCKKITDTSKDISNSADYIFNQAIDMEEEESNFSKHDLINVSIELLKHHILELEEIRKEIK